MVDLRHAETGHPKVEIDFVANLGSRRNYVPSTFAIPDAEKKAKDIHLAYYSGCKGGAA